MSNITVKFFDKEYSIPSDVVTYVGLVDFTNQVRDSLMSSFKRQIRPSVDVIESDTFMISALNEQASKFISNLLENDIYDRTANDYLQNNKGYELFLDTKKKVVNQLISIRTEKLNTYRAGVEDAIYRKESSVTGLDFGVITGSFVNSMIYAYMDASEQTKQEKEALKVYNREIEELNKQVAMYDRQESDYIIGNVIPAMNTVFTFFAYELLDKFIADLIRYDKFDGEALKFINLERSNDLLKNLSLAGNKKAVIESAFVACPFNANVYSQALNYGFIDYDTYLTAHHFKQDKNILNTLTEKLGEVTYPDKFKINYTAAEQLAKCTGRDVKAILQEKTHYYANAVVKSYKEIINLLGDKDFAVKTIYELSEAEILAGDAVSKGQASAIVEKTVKQNIWLELVDKCGHSNLIDDIKKLISEADNVFTKRDLDSLLTDKLYSLFEAVRLERAKAINEKKEQERNAKQEAELAEKERKEKRAAKIEENKQKLKKALKIVLPCLLSLIVICFTVSFIINDVVRPAKQYKAAVALMESGDYQGAINIFASLGGYKDSENLAAQCIDANLEETYNHALQLMTEGEFADAVAFLEILNGYKDSVDRIIECENNILNTKYNEASQLMVEGKYKDAYDILKSLGDYRNSNSLIEECLSAVFDENIAKLIASEKYSEAYGLLVSSGNQEQLKHFKAVYTVSNYSDKYYDSNSLYTYDEFGNLLKDVKTFDDGDKKIKDYTYDSYNRLISERITESDSPSDYFETTYEYDAHGQKIKEVTTYDYGNGNAGSYTYEYEYDSNGNMVTSIYSKAGESGEKITKYEYNSYGQMTKELYHDGTYYYFEYGSNNELLKKVYVWSDGHESFDSYQYDDNGVLVKEIDSYGNSIEYYYDSNYCLIKMVEYDEDQIDSITEYSEYKVFYLFAD